MNADGLVKLPTFESLDNFFLQISEVSAFIRVEAIDFLSQNGAVQWKTVAVPKFVNYN
jgi:hypothetical protein